MQRFDSRALARDKPFDSLTLAWDRIDPARRVAGLFLTQILPFADPTALGVFERFERAIYASRAT